MDGRIHSFETFGTVDGPGIRFVVFMQGCNFRCVYCHNPDTWLADGGKTCSSDEVLAMVERYKPYFESSGGGITVSGGEPLLQLPFVTELFIKCREKGIHTCLDTNGSAEKTEELDLLMQNTDLVLLDIKHIINESHLQLTGHGNLQVLSFARYLEKKKMTFWIRTVVIPGLTDSVAHIKTLKHFCSTFRYLEKIELLPFHKMGEYKWSELNIPYTLKNTLPPSEEHMNSLYEKL